MQNLQIVQFHYSYAIMKVKVQILQLIVSQKLLICELFKGLLITCTPEFTSCINQESNLILASIPSCNNSIYHFNRMVNWTDVNIASVGSDSGIPFYLNHAQVLHICASNTTIFNQSSFCYILILFSCCDFFIFWLSGWQIFG